MKRHLISRAAQLFYQCAFVLLVSATLSTASLAQTKPAIITGIVTDENTKEPLADVVVSLSSGGEFRTGSSGRFVIAATRSGRIVIRFRRIGYEPAAMPINAIEGDTTRVDAALAPSTTVAAADSVKTKLDTVSVKAAAVPNVPERLSEFETRRARWPNAKFVTREDIVKHGPSQLTDMFRGFPQVTVVTSHGIKMVASQRGMKSTLYQRTGSRTEMQAMSEVKDGTCILRAGVDGFVKEMGFDINTIAPDEVHGIEIFPGPASIPAKYNGSRADQYCGLVMIWTR